jgi:hypothetical protein
VEIASVQAAYAAHQARLREIDPGSDHPLLHRLRRNAFFVETDGGRLREIPLENLGVTAFYGDTATLAEAFSAAAGKTITDGDARRILEELALIEHPDETTLLAAAGRIAGRDASDPTVRAGTEALLARLCTLDGEMTRERPALDIPMREGQRLAADWAGWLAAAPTP